MVEKYGFHIELLARTSTSMHGSSEGHMGYIYRHCFTQKHMSSNKKEEAVACDPRFAEAFALVKQGDDQIRSLVKRQLHENLSTARPKRSK
jgi:hypothetical protein